MFGGGLGCRCDPFKGCEANRTENVAAAHLLHLGRRAGIGKSEG